MGDPQFWVYIRSADNPERTAEFVETYLESRSVPQANDSSCWPLCLATSADESQREARIDAQLAGTLSKTEVMVLNFYPEGCLSLRRGQKRSNMMRRL